MLKDETKSLFTKNDAKKIKEISKIVGELNDKELLSLIEDYSTFDDIHEKDSVIYKICEETNVKITKHALTTIEWVAAKELARRYNK